jgi:hypothetical protein
VGYNTHYELDHEPKSLAWSPSIERAMETLAGDDDHYNPFTSSCSWYGHVEDMVEFSKQYPNIVFTLSGEGDETGDLWRKYFKDGKVQVVRAVFTFQPFDPEKLR